METETKKFTVIIPVKCRNCRATAMIDKTDGSTGWTHSANGKHWYCPKCSMGFIG